MSAAESFAHFQRFKIEDIVERINGGDLPYIVAAVDKSNLVWRYELSCIDGSTYSNFPDYLLCKARPAKESKWGQK